MMNFNKKLEALSRNVICFLCVTVDLTWRVRYRFPAFLEKQIGKDVREGENIESWPCAAANTAHLISSPQNRYKR